MLIVDHSMVFVRALEISEIPRDTLGLWQGWKENSQHRFSAVYISDFELLIECISLKNIQTSENQNMIHLLVCISSRYDPGWAINTDYFAAHALFVVGCRAGCLRRTGGSLRCILVPYRIYLRRPAVRRLAVCVGWVSFLDRIILGLSRFVRISHVDCIGNVSWLGKLWIYWFGWE